MSTTIFKVFGIDLNAHREALVALAEAEMAPIQAFPTLFHRMKHGQRRWFGHVIAAFMQTLGYPNQIGFETVWHPDGTSSRITVFGR